MCKRVKGQSYYTHRHSCFLLQYHMVLVTMGRQPVLRGPVKTLVYNTIWDIFAERKLVILEMNGDPDHIHVLFEADPFTAPGELVNVVKTKTSRLARKQFSDTYIKKYYREQPSFWSDSYFVMTASGNSSAVVNEYIRSQ